MSERTENIKNNLEVQVKKLYKNCNEKSYETRARYRDATIRFCEFLAENYGMQKFANIKEKHLTAYVQSLKEKGISPSTMLSDLSGIRFYHRLSGEKFKLPNNENLNLDKRQVGKIDRAWSEKEISGALRLAEQMSRPDVVLAIKISNLFGTRIEETCKMRVWQILKAVEYGELYIKGKGGQERYVDVRNLEQVALLGEIISTIKAKKLQPNDYIIAQNAKSGVQRQIKSFQNWLSSHSKKFIDENRSDIPQKGYKRKSERLTFHGLRYAFAQQYEKELKAEKDPYAMKKVSEQLGHHRVAITKIYSNKK